jgi:hypothetical protein
MCSVTRNFNGLWTALLAAFCSIPCFGQTSIVAVRTSTEVVIAADSLVTNPSRPPEAVCKITLLGAKRAFALARLAEYHVVQFDAVALAMQAATKGRNLKQVEFAFRASTKPELIKALTAMKTHAPEIYKEFSPLALETLFAGIDNGTPLLIVTYYLPVVAEDGTITLKTQSRFCPGACGEPAFFTFLGEYAAINAEFRSTIESKTPINAAHDLVQLEIDAASDTVGPPIAVLRISKVGYEWPYSGKCQPDAKSK